MGVTKTQKDKNAVTASTKKKPAMKDILASKKSGGKKKNKWSKTKSKEKLNLSVIWTKAAWEKCSKDLIGKESFVTPHVISEKMKVNVSLARAAIKQLVEEGKLTAYNAEETSCYPVYVKSESFKKELEAKPATVVEGKKDKKPKK
jgi:small subunit ribosomal protein S25e